MFLKLLNDNAIKHVSRELDLVKILKHCYLEFYSLNLVLAKGSIAMPGEDICLDREIHKQACLLNLFESWKPFFIHISTKLNIWMDK